MKAAPFLLLTATIAIFMALSNSFLVGCRTASPIDWNSRVGGYTYEQAVTALGPPTRSAKLSDNRTLAEWVTRRGAGNLSVGVGGGSFGSHSTMETGQLPTGQGNGVLLLIFGPDGKLLSWSKKN